MPTPYTDKVDVLTQAVFNLISNNMVTLGLKDVWFGDQDRYPRTPAVAVEPGPKKRTYNGVSRRYEVDSETYILACVERIQDTQTNLRQVLTLSEAIEDTLHADTTLSTVNSGQPLIIDSYVSQTDPGYVTRKGTTLAVVRLTFFTRSQKELPHVP